MTNGDVMLDTRFFLDAKQNFAESPLVKHGFEDALVFRAMGIGKGDRVSTMVPIMPETIACMPAASAIDAIWSSCSPDFGE